MPSLLAPPTVARSHQHLDMELEPHPQWQSHMMLLESSPIASIRRETYEKLQANDGELYMDHAAAPALAQGFRLSTDYGIPNKLKKKQRGSAPPQLAASLYYESFSTTPKLNNPQTMSATTVTVRPLHQFPLDAAPAPAAHTTHHTTPQNEGRMGPASSPRVSMPPATYSVYPMYPGLQTSTTNKPNYRDSAPIPLNTPRRLSSSPGMPPTMPHSRQSMDSKASPRGIITNIEPVESIPKIPSYSKSRHIRAMSVGPKRRVMRKPDEMFATLPNEVLELILEKLKQLHLGAGSISCTTCWMRDLCNVCLTSQRWAPVARTALYGDVQLVGPDSAAHRKRFKLTQGARMLMLRRTLRSKPEVAALVRRLKIPALETLDNGSVPKGALTHEQYEDLTATLVMACPNLEKLTGPTPNYNHSFTKLFHALSTRANLKEMDWIIEPLAEEAQRRQQSSSPQPVGSVVPYNLELYQGNMFLDLHARWTGLRSLTIHCLPGGTLAPNGLLTELMHRLPSLQHLHLCNLPLNAFNDNNLLSLPPLQTLSLSHVSGLTANGFSAFATRANSQTLRTLHLRHTPLSSLPSLARIFSHLSNLTTFSLVQAYPPVMPETDSFTLWMMPYLASGTVSKLHWDITGQSDELNHCDDILARSIASGGFPQLRKLRAPNDPLGVFQALCRPVERIDYASDRFRRPNSSYQGRNSPPRSDQRKTLLNGLNSHPTQVRPPRCSDLCSARLAAQARLEQAREQPKFSVSVTTEEGDTAAAFHLGGYMGTVGSQIEYYLHPDLGSSDEKGGLVDMRDLGADNGESLSGGKEGCTGRWNMAEGVVADKKEKESWWHTERGRWRGIELQ